VWRSLLPRLPPEPKNKSHYITTALVLPPDPLKKQFRLFNYRFCSAALPVKNKSVKSNYRDSSARLFLTNPCTYYRFCLIPILFRHVNKTTRFCLLILSLFQNRPPCRPRLPCPEPIAALLSIASSTLCCIPNLQLSTSLLLSIGFVQIVLLNLFRPS
jgi:hypothetical protein